MKSQNVTFEEQQRRNEKRIDLWIKNRTNIEKFRNENKPNFNK